MRKVQVCTFDYQTGYNVVGYVRKVTGRHGTRKLSKTIEKAQRWSQTAIATDHSSDHVVYVRCV